MAEHFLDDLVHDLDGNGDDREHRPPWYDRHGDCIMFLMANEAVVAERIDERLTIYRSAFDERPIGFQIKDVMALIKQCGYVGLEVSTEVSSTEVKAISLEVSTEVPEPQVKPLSLTALLLAALCEGPDTIHRRAAYTKVFQTRAAHPELDAVSVV